MKVRAGVCYISMTISHLGVIIDCPLLTLGRRMREVPTPYTRSYACDHMTVCTVTRTRSHGVAYAKGAPMAAHGIREGCAIPWPYGPTSCAVHLVIERHACNPNPNPHPHHSPFTLTLALTLTLSRRAHMVAMSSSLPSSAVRAAKVLRTSTWSGLRLGSGSGLGLGLE